MIAPVPPLPLEAWEPTKDTLHLWLQVVGKVRLALTPPRNHWWHVPLYVDARGLTTGALRQGDVSVEITFDLLDHRLVLPNSEGPAPELALRDGLSVADFHDALLRLLADVGVRLEIDPRPFGVPVTTPFTEDREHASYDAEWVTRWWRVLAEVDWVFREFAGWSTAKTSPVHLFWHSMDLAVTRFSGRPAPPREADPVTREAYSHEVVSFGFWAGDPQVREPAFYAYAAPEPPGLADRPLRPSGAHWLDQGGSHLALYRYDDYRAAPDRRAALLDFLQSAWEAGAGGGGWPLDELRSQWAPPGT